MTVKMERCPHCGAILSMRFGVVLSPIKARILDLVMAQPGIATRTIDRLVFDGTGDHRAYDNVRAHVHQINAALAHTDVAIRGKSGEGFRLVKRVEVAIAA